jgi:hypothetical protein
MLPFVCVDPWRYDFQEKRMATARQKKKVEKVMHEHKKAR